MTAPVIVVDDSLTVRMDLGDAFRDAGFDVVGCASAREARDAIRASKPALVVLDVLLPDTDGIELLGEIRDRNDIADTPVILLSTEAEVRDRIRGLARGANEYVAKPYEASYVVARARALLRAARAGDGSATVLVIDDSLTHREGLAAVLRDAGYHAALASSGEEGLQRAADLRPDAIIVDGVMPGMDGTALIRKVRLDPGLRSTPCILLTASEGAASEVVALDDGADAYVRKGEGHDVVLVRLAAILRAAGASRAHTHGATLMSPKRILAVDDSPTYLEAVAEQLRDDGYEVVKAHSGEEALDLLAVEKVDCILIDLLMPGLSGMQTCERIRSSPTLRHVPLVILTARDDPAALIAGMNAGADDYVSKTATFDVIKARLRAQLRRKQLEDENRRVREQILRKEAEARIATEQADARAALLLQLETKNRELEVLNKELQMFAYSVSHDLRQPLRSMSGFSQVLLEEYAQRLDDQGRHYLRRLRAGAVRMEELIDGLLVLSRVTRKELEPTPLRIDELARSVMQRLSDTEPERQVDIDIAEPMETVGDRQLVESILENLLGNAWKFTRGRSLARIEIGERRGGEAVVYFVRDNGAGFAMEYADKLFAPFQRLHRHDQFPGTGIGLATTQRIVHRHGGRIWAEARPDEGATFYFTLSTGATGGATP